MKQQITRREFIKQGALAGATLALPVEALAARHERTQRINSTALRKFKDGLEGRLILPRHRGYEAARKVWNARFDKHPAMIVRCAAKNDVMRAVAFARRHELIVAVRGGGHSMGGQSACDGGMVIDLSDMTAVHVDPENLVVDAEPGLNRNQFLEAVGKHGLVTPMGACPDVGIAGLTLGGGEGDLMAKYGMACDALLSAEVITADGRLLAASAEQNPDLFWGIRGGAGNFGVVTSFRYRLYHLESVVAGGLIYPLSQAKDMLRFYRDAISQSPDEVTSYAGATNTGDGPVAAIMMCYCGDPKDAEKALAPLRTFGKPQSDTAKIMSYLEDNDPFPGNYGWRATGAFIPELGDDVIEAFVSSLPNSPPNYQAFFVHYHGAMTRVAESDTAFPLRRPGFSFFLMGGVRESAQLSTAGDWTERLLNELKPFSDGVYVNDLEDEGEERARSAFGANYSRLVELKNRYDPANFFRLNQNIKPTV